MSIMKKNWSSCLCHAKRCLCQTDESLPKWKQTILGLAGHKFDKMAEKYGIHYHFIFVESNGAQLQEVADLFCKLENQTLYRCSLPI